MRKVKLAFVGLGAHGRKLLSVIVNRPEFEITALSDTNEKVAKELATKYGIGKIFNPNENLFESKDFEAVVICVPPRVAPDLSINAARHKKAVLQEKPLAIDSRVGKMILEVFKNEKVRLMVAYMKRYDKGVIKAKKLLKQAAEFKKLGKIEMVTYYNFHNNHGGFYLPMIPPQKIGSQYYPRDISWIGKVPDFVSEEEKLSYGFSFCDCCHSINLMRYLFGDPYEIKFSTMKVVEDPWFLNIVTVFDYDKFNLTFINGGRETIAPWDEEIIVSFSSGAWLKLQLVGPYNVDSSRVIFFDGNDIFHSINKGEWHYAAELSHFAKCLITNEDFRSEGKDSIKDIIVYEGMYMAHKKRKPIELKYNK